MKIGNDTIKINNIIELEIIEDGLMLYRKQMVELNKTDCLEKIDSMIDQLDIMWRNWN